jgi:hypothetical protein
VQRAGCPVLVVPARSGVSAADARAPEPATVGA